MRFSAFVIMMISVGVLTHPAQVTAQASGPTYDQVVAACAQKMFPPLDFKDIAEGKWPDPNIYTWGPAQQGYMEECAAHFGYQYQGEDYVGDGTEQYGSDSAVSSLTGQTYHYQNVFRTHGIPFDDPNQDAVSSGSGANPNGAPVRQIYVPKEKKTNNRLMLVPRGGR